MAITLAIARTIIDAGIAKAKQMGLLVSIAVLDAGGHVIAVERMDGAGFLTPEIAHGKAFAAAAFRRSSADVQTKAQGKPTFFSGISSMTQGRFLAGMGGLPVRDDDRCLGGVGVSGGTAEQDQEIAQAGIAAIPGR